MSKFFGPVTQIGYVVRDAAAAMDKWVALGVGPFFYSERLTIYMNYRGVESSVDIGVGKANSGPLQIEVIAPLDDTPSPWRDFIAAGNEGAQHVAYWTKDFDGLLALATQLGHTVCMQGTVDREASDGRMAYLDHGPIPGTMIEISDRSGRKAATDAKIREAATDWDGSDPIRPLADIWMIGTAPST